ncbi:DUF2256 domain-containing protein [Methylocystis sp. WRRC1]|uniref:DUF2256 domain-containing protein n=1 Tax=unclassified Methylocystis TaxID=2625913 RepID=UPI000A05F2C3|nr:MULTISPECIES: DUF2256 domain-containing protein [unclassified Methylocystis]MCC3244946.1 DUF2256 domain-containing protein [Methylocystis sp. WRRC1]
MSKPRQSPARSKTDLPEKICLACGRPFAWRKKWRECWEEVKTCSERCKGDLRRARRAQKKESA